MADYTSTNNSEPRGAVDRGESADDWIQPATRYRLRNIFITSLAVIKSSLGELGLGSHDDLVTFTAAEVSGAKDGVEAMELLGTLASILCFPILECRDGWFDPCVAHCLQRPNHPYSPDDGLLLR